MSTAASVMYELVTLMEEIDEVSFHLKGIQRRIFGSPHFRKPKLNPAELGFIRCVTYVYVMLLDIAKPDLEFLVGLFGSLHVTEYPRQKEFLSFISKLRTFLQHNLNPARSGDKTTINTCEDWFHAHCATPVPDSEVHWQQCVLAFLEEARDFAQCIKKCIRSIEDDETVEAIVGQWSIHRLRHPRPHEFDPVISIAARDMGRDFIDVTKIRKRNYHKWISHLETLSGQFDFKEVARRLAEEAIMEQTINVLPIDGNDIIQCIGIAPGPNVGKLLEWARYLHAGDRTIDRNKLLEALEEKARNLGMECDPPNRPAS